MKNSFFALVASLLLLGSTTQATALPSVLLDNVPVALDGWVDQGTTYVPLRRTAQLLCPRAEVRWEEGQAIVTSASTVLSAVPGESWVTVNEALLYVPRGVVAKDGSLYLPIRTLAEAFGAQVRWETEEQAVYLTSGTGYDGLAYDPDALYWLSRIISAESQGEPLEGQIAVGNVVLNRVASPEFPDSIYGVIFDSRWGGQFKPVENGTIYDPPAEQSIRAAKLCLSGASTVGNSLYFLDPEKAENLWTTENRDYVTTIGTHWFYA